MNKGKERVTGTSSGEAHSEALLLKEGDAVALLPGVPFRRESRRAGPT